MAYYSNSITSKCPLKTQSHLSLTMASFISLSLNIFRKAGKWTPTIFSNQNLSKNNFIFIEPTLIPSTTSSFAAAESPSSS